VTTAVRYTTEWDMISTFSKNWERLMRTDVAKTFMSELLNLPWVRGLISFEQFSVDGTLIDARTSMKSFSPNNGSGGPRSIGRKGKRNIHKEKRSNATQSSTTNPEAPLCRE
jgi:hypothetical protein